MTERAVATYTLAPAASATAPTGSAAEANATPVAKDDADVAFDNAACIGCGACVAACPNASAMLFTAAKLSHLAALPQGQPERERRTLSMVAAQDSLGFGGCTNIGECAAVCPKEIPMESIAPMNRELLRASLKRGRGRAAERLRGQPRFRAGPAGRPA
ncbi:MAG: succinate dehydrogenase / fumarate reductase, iron-sulfur subunit, partial [Acidimicrobiaceae bacterium]|nr:succinate dehydrogenase / fumarate reductase, iron-sulfur subunit [Acidimicrobiaceae bacterium]